MTTPPSARNQCFYALPKTHKETLKIRPIVSACGGIFDRLGWFLQQILKPLLTKVSAHVKNTSELIERFNSVSPADLQGMIPISFDVVSLYTNVDITEAIETTLEYINKYGLYLYGLTTAEIWELLHLLLDNNVFSYEEHGFYKQIRGLAMGNRLSGTLAILVMDRFERNFVYQELKPSPIIYVRYVDDVGTVAEGTNAAKDVLKYLNKKHPTIQFELEIPDDNKFLPILDIKIKIQQDGSIERKPFTKKANKGITLHFDSHHSSAIKRATAINEIDRATACSTPEHRATALQQTCEKLLSNGYSDSWIKTTKNLAKKKNKKQRSRPIFVMKIPFLTDAFNHSVQNLLDKHGIPARLVNPRGKTLREFTRKPTPGSTSTNVCKSRTCPAPTICQRTSVVYQAECKHCGSKYIGMTTRKLHDRIREHVLSAKRGSEESAIGEHYKENHPGMQPNLTFTIIRHQRDELRLHIEEAMAIKLNKPDLNRRQEDLGTGFLP